MKLEDTFFPLDKSGNQQKKLLEEWILERPSSQFVENNAPFDPRWMCLAVWGMGGLGKTTILEQIIYHNKSLAQKFHCTAWITVSKTYSVVDLLRDLLNKLAKPRQEVDIHNMEEEGLVRKIHHIVDQKRYLIVFDDVWQSDFWSKMQTVFRSCDYHQGSRILLATREQKVAVSVARRDRVMLLSHLNEEQAWSLFCQEAFWQEGPPWICPDHLESCGRRLVQKCEGLPLAIVTVAGMVSREDRKGLIWEKICKMLDTKLGDEPELNIFMHSYYNLPLHLKRCFLYFTTWPGDWFHDDDYIVRLWIVEGFIEEKDGATLEETGKGYIEELVRRSMMIRRKPDDSPYTVYRIHGIFRAVGFKVSQGQNFATVVDGDYHENYSPDARRLQIFEPNNDGIRDFPKLRSLLLHCNIPVSSFRKFKLLKLLDLPGFPKTDIPDEIFDLFNLRYLNLKNSKIKKVPCEIGRLQNLQYLIVHGTKVKELPRDIRKLKKLRVLQCGGGNTNPGAEVPAETFYLQSLQFLLNIKASVEVVEKLGGLTQLRELGITNVKPSHEEQLSSSLKRMEHLRILQLENADDDGPIDLESLNPAHPSGLEIIVLNTAIKGIPTWFKYLENLTVLYLGHSMIEDGGDLLGNLISLPCLENICLQNTFQGTELMFPSGCFQSLEKLILASLSNLTCVEIEASALRNLRRITIDSCGKLTTSIVGETEKLERLEEIILKGMAPDVVQHFQDILEGRVKLTVIES